VTYPGAPGTDTTVLPEQVGRLDLVIEQPLYHAGAKPARVRFEAEISLADLDYRKSLTAIAESMRKLYIDFRRAESAVRVASEGVAGCQRYYDLVKHLIDAGSAKPIDLQTASGQLAEANAGLAEAESGVKISMFAINQSMGRAMNSPLNISPPATDLDIVEGRYIPLSVDEVKRSAQLLRPEIVELRLELDAARSGVSLAKSQSQPNLVARGQVTEQTPSAFVHEHYASAMLQIKLPIFDNDKTKMDTREAEAQVKRLEALLEQAKSGVDLDVLKALSRFQVVRDRLAAARQQTTALSATSTVTTTAYSVGRATAIDVQSAQRELRLAKEKEAQAEIDVLSANDDLVHAEGSVDTLVDRMAPLPPVRQNR
jgi:outer membrane protein TolC